VPKGELPLFAGDLDGEGIVEGAVTLPAMTEGEEVVEDYVAMRLTLRSHPVALVRHRLSPGLDPRWLEAPDTRTARIPLSSGTDRP